VRRFTTQTTKIIQLIPSDTGRPITDLVTTLDYTNLVTDAREVLQSLILHETQVPAKDGRWLSVHIMPYRTQYHRIDGVVIIFNDISIIKKASDESHESPQMLQKVLDNIPQRVYWKDHNSVIVGDNQTYAKDCGYADPNELEGKTDYDISPRAEAKRSIADDRKIMKSGNAKLKFEEKLTRPNGQQSWSSSNKIPLTNIDGKVTGILAVCREMKIMSHFKPLGIVLTWSICLGNSP
jgi:two-component system CheB/CheR fusion protein